MSIRVSKHHAMALARVLKMITSESHIDTLAIISQTGARVAFFSTQKDADPHEMCAIGAALSNSGALALQKVGFGNLSDIMIRGNNGFLILKSMDRFILVGGAREKQAFMEATQVLLKYSKQLSSILEEVPDEEY